MIYPASYTQTGTPIKKLGRKIFLFGFVSGETTFETPDNRPVCTMIDLDKDSISYLISYPEQYVQFNWGGGLLYRQPYYDIDDTSIIVSFSADHHIVKYALDGNQNKFYAGSSSVNKIKSFPHDKDMPGNSDEEWKWYMENPSYQNVIYDKYRKLYYRMVRLPIKDYVPTAIGNAKPVVIVVLDSKLNYLGEVTLPAHITWKPHNCFVSKEGFNIQAVTDDEDKLIFYQYNFIKDET
jgi:hypothetical protein